MPTPKMWDRVKVIASATGTGAFSVGAAAAGGWLTPAAAGAVSGDNGYYCAVQGELMEVGIGTLTSGAPWSWSRDTVLKSSNGGAKVAFAAGDIDLICAAPAEIVQPGGKLRAIASGTISSGATVIVNEDETVSVVAAIPVGPGTAAVFESASTDNISACYDATNSKVIIVYRDTGNGNYGTAVVGTVLGASISFGTPVVFISHSVILPSVCYDATNNKVVIAYCDVTYSSIGVAIVGTVSGTSISFGTAVTFKSATTGYISACFDSTDGKVVIAYADGGNGNYGKSIVGTVSGTAISFGTEVVFKSASIAECSACYASASKVVISWRNDADGVGLAVVGTVSGTSISFGTVVTFSAHNVSEMCSCYDTTNGKVVIAFIDYTNSGYGSAIVGTVSGTSISFGTAVVFESANTDNISACYDATSGKVLISYRDIGNNNYGTAIVGTVSGTSISFGTAAVFRSANVINTFACASASAKVVIAYSDGEGGNYGTAIIYAMAASSNVSAENFVGIAQTAAANGASVLIATTGAVDERQSGLIPGRKYYIADNGTLTLTNTGRYAGKSIGATKLLIG